jgi:hypothetical protein
LGWLRLPGRNGGKAATSGAAVTDRSSSGSPAPGSKSQLPHAISDAEDMLFACALVYSKCLPLQVLQCGQVLAPAASTGTMKEPRCVAMPSLQLLFKGILW